MAGTFYTGAQKGAFFVIDSVNNEYKDMT